MPPPNDPGAAARWRLSRFAYLHREGDAIVLKSARGPARIVLPDSASLVAFAALVVPQTLDDLMRAGDGLGRGEAEALVASLSSAGLIERVDEEGRSPESVDRTLQQWEFHDRLFRGRERTMASPATSPAPAPARVLLPLPTGSPVEASFTAVLESRRSVRRFGDAPIALAQVGAFLFRVAGDRRVSEEALQLYATVDRCAGLPPGIYRYVPAGHGFDVLEVRAADVAALQRQAMRCAELERPPQVLLTLVAPRDRHPAEAPDYADVLRDVGAIYQQMYLLATALGLGACALGTGDADLFARATGTDPMNSPAVGEFVLGSLP